MELTRAFKEWAIVCDALLAGTQTTLLRKGGIREEGGRFSIDDKTFLLMPTYEHQNISLIREEHMSLIERNSRSPVGPDNVQISGWAEAISIFKVHDDEHLVNLASEHVWNDKYIQLRLEFNPYDPLYIIVLRTYKLAEPITLPMIPELAGCKSWVNLNQSVSTRDSQPSLNDSEFTVRLHVIEQMFSSDLTD